MRLAELMLWVDDLESVPDARQLGDTGFLGAIAVGAFFSDPRRKQPPSPADTTAFEVHQALLGAAARRSSQGANDTPMEEVLLLGKWSQHGLQRLKRSLLAGEAPLELAKGIVAAAFELADNVAEHSGLQQPAPAVLAYRITRGLAEVAVVDGGIGVLAGLRPVHREITDSRHALRATVLQGLSRKRNGGGQGLRTVQKKIADAAGELAFRSGDAVLTIDGTRSREARIVRTRPASPVRGFFAAARARWHAPT